MKKLAIAAVAAATSLFAAVGAHAQAHVGIAAGPSHLDGCGDVAQCDDEDTGFKVFGGYGFGNGLSIEGTYINFGKVKGTGFGPQPEVTGTTLGVGVAYSANFNESFTGTARVGLGSNKADLEFNGFSNDESKVKPYFGLAVGYRLTNALSLEAGVDFTQFEYEGQKADARLVSIGAKFEF